MSQQKSSDVFCMYLLLSAHIASASSRFSSRTTIRKLYRYFIVNMYTSVFYLYIYSFSCIFLLFLILSGVTIQEI